MKTLFKILFTLIIVLSYFSNISYANWDLISPEIWNLKTGSDNWKNSVVDKNKFLNWLENGKTDFSVSNWWEKWILNSIIRIARDLKNLFFLIAWVYFLILVVKLLFAEKTEEEVSKFKNWIIWISIWIVITQLAYYFINVLFDQEITNELSANFIKIIIEPLIWLLQTLASFFFIAIMIFSFYKMVTSNWDEEAAKSWKMSVLYAAMWFIVIKISNALITTTYWKTNCSNSYQTNCTNTTNLDWFASIIVTIINWMNGFVWIIVILMIIYAWFLTLTSGWDEEKLKKAKQSIMYISIWLFILVTNYLILSFFILPEAKI